MKILNLVILTAILSATLNAQPPKGEAKRGDTYGSAVDVAGAEDISTVASRVNSPDTLNVKVKGTVKEVCKQKGCWATIRVNDSTEAFVKMRNYGFFVPTALEGKTVVLEGKAFVKTTSVAELKHYAEDGGKSQEEIDAITQPESQLRLLASGIVVTE